MSKHILQLFRAACSRLRLVVVGSFLLSGFFGVECGLLVLRFIVGCQAFLGSKYHSYFGLLLRYCKRHIL
jgi:hypothetical protein